MMAQVNAGRVRFVGRGEYNNSTQYYVFDLVSYNGNSYYAKADTIGHLPTDTTYWQLVAEKGNVGPTGLTGNGISSIEKTSTSGLVDTYTITYTNGNTTTFDVSNGNGIDRIEKTATVGNKDTYTIYFTNGSTTTYEVVNGEVTREELEEEVDRLSMIYNAFPSTTGEVEEGSINGTAEVPFKEIGLKGNTSQESTTGKNLLPNNATTQTIRGITFTINEDKSITLNGTNDNTGSSTLFLITEADNFSLNAGTYNSIATGVSGVNIGAYDGTNYYTFAGGSGNSITLQNNTSFASVYLQVSKGNSTTFNNKKIYPILSLTPVSESDYEPYTNGPAPNPDYPYPVNVVTGDNTITSCGKNFFDEDYYKNATYGSNIYKYVLATFKGNRKLYTKCSLKTGKTAISGLYMAISSKTNPNIVGNVTNWLVSNSNPISGTADFIDDKDLYFVYYPATITPQEIFDTYNVMVSTTLMNYEPYQSQTYPINLGSMELCKIGDYQDYLYKENGIWYKYGAIGKVVLDGSENWADYTTQYTNYYTSYCTTKHFGHTGNMLNPNLFLINNFQSQWANFAVEKQFVASSLYATYIKISSSIVSTANDLKTWLSTHNTTVYYVLNTPTITPITDTTLIEQLDNLEKAYSYDTQTNISQTNQDKPFIISYEAILSLRNVLNS